MSNTYNMYPAESTQWGRGNQEPFSQRASLAELRFLGARGVDIEEYQEDERLARDVRSAERVAGQTAVNLSLETRD